MCSTRTSWSVICLLIVILVAGACAPAAAPPPAAPAAAAPTTAPAAVATKAPIMTPVPTAAPAAAAAAPAATGGRGSCGTLRLLWWQGPTILNPHLAQGTKDWDASRVVYEPLASYDQDGKLDITYGLAAEVPTVANGGITADGTSITWKLKKDVKWSDGTPFTADDVIFTYQFVTNKETAATTIQKMINIKDVAKLDDYTIKITWKAPNPVPYEAFTGTQGDIIQKKAFQDYTGAKAMNAPANLKPVGTNAYMIKDFRPGDVALFEINPYYRDPNKPCFKEVNMKGGGDVTQATRAVLVTGDADYAWNVQVAADVLQDMLNSGKGELVGGLGGNSERLSLQFTNVDSSQGDKRGEPGNEHPFLTDPKVRQALALAIDRWTIVKQLYGDGLTGKVTCNLLTGPPQYVSDTKFDTCEYNMDKAAKLLDDAGWVKGADGVRAKNGVKMHMLLQTSVNAVRQKQQEIIKAGWEKLGVPTELKSVDASIFFSRDLGNPDTYAKFWADAEMYGSQPTSPDDVAYMAGYTCAEIKTKAQGWAGTNLERYCNPAYDKIIDQLHTELDPAKRAALYRQANDQLIKDSVMVPLVAKYQPFGAKSKLLKGVAVGGFDTELWNLANWSK